MPEKYRKKSVVVEAELFSDENKDRAFSFITCNKYPDFDSKGNPTLRIQTLEGEIMASLGDYIIKGVKGEFYPCKPDIFAITYELAESETITISKDKYEELIKDQAKLRALEAGGVDNWEWYGESLKDYFKEYDV
jgi:hypothetical protein